MNWTLVIALVILGMLVTGEVVETVVNLVRGRPAPLTGQTSDFSAELEVIGPQGQSGKVYVAFDDEDGMLDFLARWDTTQREAARSPVTPVRWPDPA